MGPNIKEAYALVNGVKVPATYDADTGLYAIETVAPPESSWDKPGHVILVSLHAEDLAGNTVAVDSTDEEYGDQLKIRVLEKTKPVAEIISPTQDSVLGSSTQAIQLSVIDYGGSGLNMNSVTFKVNNELVSNGELEWTDTEDGTKEATYVATGLSDGVNKVELSVNDNDGNVSDTAAVQFIISTAAPLLIVTTPVDGLITNDTELIVTGKAAPGTDYTVLDGVKVNGVYAIPGETDADGYTEFSASIDLTRGENTIIVVAEDVLQKTTSITRTVTLDLEAPVISDVQTVSTTVDANGMIKITFKVTDT